MTVHDDGVTRREVLTMGLAAGGAALAASAFGGGTVAALPFPAEALSAGVPGARSLGIDAYAFWPDKASDRIYQDLTGSQPITPGRRIWAPLPIPAGSIVVQLSASYQGQPILELSRRPLFSGGTATAPSQVFQQTLPAGPGGPFASSLAVPSVKIDENATYTVSAYCLAGESIIGVKVGYLEGFVPYIGSKPRVYDSREPGAGGKLVAGADRVVQLGVPGRVAIFNLTVVSTDGPGFVAAFAGNIDYPGTSNVNYAGANALAANSVLSAMDTSGAIKLRAGVNGCHAFIDLVGSLV